MLMSRVITQRRRVRPRGGRTCRLRAGRNERRAATDTQTSTFAKVIRDVALTYPPLLGAATRVVLRRLEERREEYIAAEREKEI